MYIHRPCIHTSTPHYEKLLLERVSDGPYRQRQPVELLLKQHYYTWNDPYALPLLCSRQHPRAKLSSSKFLSGGTDNNTGILTCWNITAGERSLLIARSLLPSASPSTKYLSENALSIALPTSPAHSPIKPCCLWGIVAIRLPRYFLRNTSFYKAPPATTVWHHHQHPDTSSSRSTATGQLSPCTSRIFCATASPSKVHIL